MLSKLVFALYSLIIKQKPQRGNLLSEGNSSLGPVLLVLFSRRQSRNERRLLRGGVRGGVCFLENLPKDDPEKKPQLLRVNAGLLCEFAESRAVIRDWNPLVSKNLLQNSTSNHALKLLIHLGPPFSQTICSSLVIAEAHASAKDNRAKTDVGCIFQGLFPKRCNQLRRPISMKRTNFPII